MRRTHDLDNSDARLFYVDNLVRKRRSYSGRKRLSYSSGAIAVGLPPAAESLGQAKCAASREGRREAFTGETGCGIRGNDWQQGARKCRRRDRLGDRTRTLMCEEKIHLFDTSSSFGFSRFGGDGRARWENDLLCWGWTVSSRCVGEKIQGSLSCTSGPWLLDRKRLHRREQWDHRGDERRSEQGDNRHHTSAARDEG